jgi:hypothetical protein
MTMIALLRTLQELTDNALRRTQQGTVQVSPGLAGTLVAETITRSKRYELSGSVTIYDLDSRPITTGVLNDISVGGLSFFAAIELNIQQFIKLQFQIENFTLLVRAIVLRRCGFKYAVEFLRLTESQREMIDKQLQLACGWPEDHS